VLENRGSDPSKFFMLTSSTQIATTAQNEKARPQRPGFSL
jgi:hypothetical protein